MTDGLPPTGMKREQKNITSFKNESLKSPPVKTALRSKEAMITESNGKTDVFDQIS